MSSNAMRMQFSTTRQKSELQPWFLETVTISSPSSGDPPIELSPESSLLAEAIALLLDALISPQIFAPRKLLQNLITLKLISNRIYREGFQLKNYYSLRH